MKCQDMTVSKTGITIGDLVLVNKANGFYGRVVKISRRFYEDSDWHVRRSRRASIRVNAGDEATSILTIAKVLNLNLTNVKRKTKLDIEEPLTVLISKEFISKMFRTLNDTLAHSKMISEQEGLI